MKQHYEEAKFTLPPVIPENIWYKNRDKLEKTPTNCQITVHSGPTESIAAMATIDLADLRELVSKYCVISYLPIIFFMENLPYFSSALFSQNIWCHFNTLEVKKKGQAIWK